MPTVAIIDGIKIKLYWDEHFPAHFHAELAEYEAQVAIESLRVIEATYLLNSSERLWLGQGRESPSYSKRG